MQNKIIIACAGSGKTTRLVEAALRNRSGRTLILTYTNNNKRQIVSKFETMNSGVPSNVEIETWITFLLRECARPYQRSHCSESRLEGVRFVNQQSTKGIAESSRRAYYLARDNHVYSDKLSQLVVGCQTSSQGKVSDRLCRMYTHIFIDEFQDLAGWDLEVVEFLLRSNICVTLIGDPRQHIYSTHNSRKNKQYLGVKIKGLLDKWERAGLCVQDRPMNDSHRCHKDICSFSNLLWPEMEAMISRQEAFHDDHQGVFLVAEKHVNAYCNHYCPQVLRYDMRGKDYGRTAMNFGASKGLEFDRVLIVGTKPIRQFLATGEIRHIESSREKLHVAVTRARRSVAFVLDDDSCLVTKRYVSG